MFERNLKVRLDIFDSSFDMTTIKKHEDFVPKN